MGTGDSRTGQGSGCMPCPLGCTVAHAMLLVVAYGAILLTIPGCHA